MSDPVKSHPLIIGIRNLATDQLAIIQGYASNVSTQHIRS